jgi:LmbE family N-acetylglucosaminyl deacetylase
MKKVMVIAPHPDDETLGCGGTLLKHAAQGDRLYWGIVTTLAGMPGATPAHVKRRESVIASVGKAFPFAGILRGRWPATTLDAIPRAEMVAWFRKIMEEVKPQILYLPFPHDAHSDHGSVFEAAYACTKSFRAPYLQSVRVMEIPSETEFAPPLPSRCFQPNLFVDISDFLEAKLKVLRHYRGELQPHPFPRSTGALRALARWRGSTAGCAAAEAFQVLKEYA